ncbi:unnamed protein product [Ceratitis capitata]|uniref:(Mediterranean fruit fly) hypothetical protein n=1 Tax=Ceratitis capitata TaxID=7213 RepID=A0A811UKZ4_CERCA|nr:unnamed protein product [Ceratitis capitata]
MGVGGSTNRDDRYRTPSPNSYAYREYDRPPGRQQEVSYNTSRTVSEHSVGPRIVVHGVPHIDHPSQYEVRQRTSARTQTQSKHKQTPAMHTLTDASMCPQEVHATSTTPPALRPPQPTHARTGALMCPQDFGTSTRLPPMSVQSTPKAAPQLTRPPQSMQQTFTGTPLELLPTTTAQQAPPPTRNPIETCNCKACRERDETLAAYAAGPAAAATRTYVAPNECSTSVAAPKHTSCTTTDPSCTSNSRVPPRSNSTAFSALPQSTRIECDASGSCRRVLNDTRTLDITAIERPETNYSHMHRDSFYADKTNRMNESSLAPLQQAQASQPERQTYYDERATTRSQPDFHHECLETHNRLRARHRNCPPLTLSNELSKYAQQWAKHLAATGRLEHRQVHTYGENLYTARGMEVTAAKVVQSWYDEIRYYDFSKGSYKPGTGHFTQIVWRESRQLGVGIATKGDTTYVVCNYNPPGNILGSFDSMVPPLK